MKILLLVMFCAGLLFLAFSVYQAHLFFKSPSLVSNLKDGDILKIIRTNTFTIWLETSIRNRHINYNQHLSLVDTRTKDITPIDQADFKVNYVSRTLKVNHLLYTFNAVPGTYQFNCDDFPINNGHYVIKKSNPLNSFLAYLFSLIIGLLLAISSVIIYLTIFFSTN